MSARSHREQSCARQRTKCRRQPVRYAASIGAGRGRRDRRASRTSKEVYWESDSDMATDYDAPRRDEVDLGADSIEELKSRRADAQSASVDVDEIDVAEGFELPGAELADEELTVKVLPMQADEFRCSNCFLVR